MAVRYRRSSSLEGHAQVIGRFVLPRVAGCVKGGASRARERDDANVDIPCRPDIALSRKHLGRSTDVISLHQRGVLVTRIRRKTRCREKNVVKRIQSKKKSEAIRLGDPSQQGFNVVPTSAEGNLQAE